MRFADIPGHEEVKERLRSLADTDRIPHALLLEGPAGTGKFALARAFAQYVHCQNRTNGDSCGRCPACQQHQTFNHIDTIFCFPIIKNQKKKLSLCDDYLPEFRDQMQQSPFMDYDQWLLKLDNINAQPVIYVDEAAELTRKLSFTSHSSRYKIVLMWLPEKMREEAANKLLKILEEPHSDTIFVLASDNSRQILGTIYSRTQRIIVKRYPDQLVAQYLTSQFPMDEAEAMQTARLAEGSLTEALRLISLSKERTKYLDLFKELMRKAYTRNVGDLKKWAADTAELGREREMGFLEYCSRMLRENFILNLRQPTLLGMDQEEYQFSQKFSPFINERNVLRLFDQFNKARNDIAANANAKLVNFDLALKTILLLKN
ncbi:MAG: AAA family ATPase [Bacteroidales bacterium]|nr:AAA family ATPase [Bacteroidales bacterium]